MLHNISVILILDRESQGLSAFIIVLYVKFEKAGDSMASPESIKHVPKTYITLECCHILSFLQVS